MMIHLFFFLSWIFIIGLCWGSFLNVIAYRIAFDEYFLTKRSYCPNCRTIISWYDNIPVISWFILQGKCRFCKKKISWLYPAIELSTALIITVYSYQLLTPLSTHCNIIPSLITIINQHFNLFGCWLTHIIFFSAMLVNTATDIYQLTIAQIFTLWIIPICWLSAWYNFLPISLANSIVGSLFGYILLWTIGFIFKKIQGIDGIGEGDFELMALIGSISGISGVWHTLLLGSGIGSIFGIIYLFLTKQARSTPLPFGPFLSIGAIIYLLNTNFTETLRTVFLKIIFN